MAKEKKDVYSIITERIIQKMEEGTIPWHKPWKVYDDGMAHRNLVSGKPYRGINAFMTHMSMYDSPFWVTAKQCIAQGGSITKGEKGTPIVFWSFRSKEQLEEAKNAGKPIAPFLVRYYTVFNSDQCEGLVVPQIKQVDLADHERIEQCETIVKNMPKAPTIHTRGQQACYSPSKDDVYMPKLGAFTGAEEYYSTLFHELIHSTGHDTRLKRKELSTITSMFSNSYAKEELVAECGAAFLCGKAGIENKTIDNSAAYLKAWLKRLKDDPKLIVHAAQAAQKAADFVLGEHKEYSKKEEPVKQAA